MLKVFFIIFWLFFIMTPRGSCVPIQTPDLEERNEFVIRSPDNWGYRTFRGKNGLIGVLWPGNVSFNMTDTACFVFLQTADQSIPEVPDNVNLFREKCPEADFKFFSEENDNPTYSLAETYFTGRCGRTTILFKETIRQYTLIFALISGRYISKREFADIKNVVKAYRIEVKKYLKMDISDELKKEEKQNATADETKIKKSV